MLANPTADLQFDCNNPLPLNHRCMLPMGGWMDGWKTKKRTNAQSRRMVLVFFALETRVPWRQNNHIAVGSLGSGLGLVQHAGRIEPWI